MSVLDPRRRRRTLLILLLLTSITVLSLDYQGFRPLNQVQSVARSIVDPLAGSSDSITSPITNAWRSVTEFEDLQDENSRLKGELAELRGNSIQASAAEDSLRALLEEIEIDYIGGADTVVAQVVDRPGNFESYSIEIDRGTDDGVRRGMPVVTSAGLVGRVSEVQAGFSQVRLLHQPEFPLGIRVVGTGEVALARGQGIGQDLVVKEGIIEETIIKVGDPVVTSGIEGSSYPPDLVVGVISEVEFDTRLLEQEISVRLIADLDDLRFVTIILWTVDGDSTS
ncbi:MAG: rod shape-determining protein MreC [Acidimicrobiales bacterium]|jgi:rod shape-determining protein MreC